MNSLLYPMPNRSCELFVMWCQIFWDNHIDVLYEQHLKYQLSRHYWEQLKLKGNKE